MDEKEQLSFPAFPLETSPSAKLPHEQQQEKRSIDTESGEGREEFDRNRLRVTTSYGEGPDHLDVPDGQSPISPSQQRERSRRLDDDLTVLQAERMVSRAESAQEANGDARSITRSRSRAGGEPVDDFDISTNPIHETAKVYQPPAHPATSLAKFFKKLHEASFLVRYFFYITPLTLLLLIPTLLGLLVFKESTVGGVRLFWFGIWLEIVWLTLWLSRVSPPRLRPAPLLI